MKKKVLFLVLSFVTLVMFSLNNRNIAFANTQKNSDSEIRKTNTKVKKAPLNVDEMTEEFIVNFDLMGGYSDSDYLIQNVKSGDLLIEPSDPKKISGFFRGWITDEGKRWNFDSDIVTSDLTLYAKWEWDASYSISDHKDSDHKTLTDYIDQKFEDHGGFYDRFVYQTSDITGAVPIEVATSLFPESDILAALAASESQSSYGGCGALAMIGIMDYFARYLGYNQIMENPMASYDRQKLAKDVFNNVKSYELGFGDKQTLILPKDYKSGFNGIMNLYGLSNKIKAYNPGMTEKPDDDINKIKESIKKGLPVTLYTALCGNGDLDDHYINVYGYQEWVVTDKNGDTNIQTFLLFRNNFGRTETEYADADILRQSITGIIYYEILGYDHENLVVASDFSTQFVNSSGQGQYFFYPLIASITTSSGYSFSTNRLRCSYIENQYLVLSANRSGAGEAYLEFNLNHHLMGITFDVSLWGPYEKISDGYIDIEYYDTTDNTWTLQRRIKPTLISNVRENPDNIIVLFPENVGRFRIRVTKPSPSGDRNKGRVVINNIKICYNNE